MSYMSDFVNNVCYSLDLNNNTLSQEGQTQNLWTSSTESIGNAWLNETDGTDLLEQFVNNVPGIQTDHNFMTILNNISAFPLTEWSMHAITTLQGYLAANYDQSDMKDMASAYSSELGQQASVIQAQSSQDTSIGDSVAKAELSTMQNSTSAGQPNSDAGNAVTGLLTSGANAQAAISV